MSRQLGFFADEGPQDFPELNKCPDCETFFASDTCPLCGKVCPEEMRAGNRKPVKVPKHRRSNGSGRVQFVPWYQSLWFIILMSVIQPIVGLILVWTCYWKTHWKVIVSLCILLPYLLAYFGLGIGWIIGLFHQPELPVDLDSSRAEYTALCEQADPATLFRYADSRIGEYVCITVTVEWMLYDEYDETGLYEYLSHYRVQAVDASGKSWTFLLRDFRQSDKINFTEGDTVTVYGQICGTQTVENTTYDTVSAPCIGMVYADLTE